MSSTGYSSKSRNGLKIAQSFASAVGSSVSATAKPPRPSTRPTHWSIFALGVHLLNTSRDRFIAARFSWPDPPDRVVHWSTYFTSASPLYGSARAPLQARRAAQRTAGSDEGRGGYGSSSRWSPFTL